MFEIEVIYACVKKGALLPSENKSNNRQLWLDANRGLVLFNRKYYKGDQKSFNNFIALVLQISSDEVHEIYQYYSQLLTAPEQAIIENKFAPDSVQYFYYTNIYKTDDEKIKACSVMAFFRRKPLDGETFIVPGEIINNWQLISGQGYLLENTLASNPIIGDFYALSASQNPSLNVAEVDKEFNRISENFKTCLEQQIGVINSYLYSTAEILSVEIADYSNQFKEDAKLLTQLAEILYINTHLLLVPADVITCQVYRELAYSLPVAMSNIKQLMLVFCNVFIADLELNGKILLIESACKRDLGLIFYFGHYETNLRSAIDHILRQSFARSAQDQLLTCIRNILVNIKYRVVQEEVHKYQELIKSAAQDLALNPLLLNLLIEIIRANYILAKEQLADSSFDPKCSDELFNIIMQLVEEIENVKDKNWNNPAHLNILVDILLAVSHLIANGICHLNLEKTRSLSPELENIINSCINELNNSNPVSLTERQMFERAKTQLGEVIINGGYMAGLEDLVYGIKDLIDSLEIKALTEEQAKVVHYFLSKILNQTRKLICHPEDDLIHEYSSILPERLGKIKSEKVNALRDAMQALIKQINDMRAEHNFQRKNLIGLTKIERATQMAQANVLRECIESSKKPGANFASLAKIIYATSEVVEHYGNAIFIENYIALIESLDRHPWAKFIVGPMITLACALIFLFCLGVTLQLFGVSLALAIIFFEVSSSCFEGVFITAAVFSLGCSFFGAKVIYNSVHTNRLDTELDDSSCEEDSTLSQTSTC